MPDLVRTLLIITGIIVVLFMLLVGFNVWAFTNVPARLASPVERQAQDHATTLAVSPAPFSSRWQS